MRRIAVRCADQVRYFPLPPGPARLGSAPDNDLVVPFRGVSRHHALLHPAAAGVLLTDLGSTNGLVRDGRRHAELLLVPGDAVQLGRAVLTLEEVPSGDGEIALPLSVGRDETRLPSSALTAALRGGSSSASLRCALQLVRELERLSPREVAEQRDRWLQRAQRSLGAESLALFHAGALASCAGTYQEDVAPFLVAGDRDSLHLTVHFAGRPEPWQEELFDYLAEKLLPSGTPARTRTAPTPRAEPLRFPAGLVVGGSPAFQALVRDLEAAARSDLPVLLLGETGTGKELLARTLHDSGPRTTGHFVALNCATIPTELLESELFGVAGKVATQVEPRPGLVVRADGGTLFLDEIGEMPAPLQAKLLRVLQEKEVHPLGAPRPIKVRFRLLSASHRDLTALVAEERFREDLYYRLCGFTVRIPPLRERREDLPALVLALVARAAAKYDKRIQGVSRRALALLHHHPWPGNVRELERQLEQAVVRCLDGGTLQREHFPDLAEPAPEPAVETVPVPAESGTLQEQVDALERDAIRRALAETDGNKTRAAQKLGLSRYGLQLKMRRLQLPS
jgi:two-component system response regulator PilR (NtrC family)